MHFQTIYYFLILVSVAEPCQGRTKGRANRNTNILGALKRNCSNRKCGASELMFPHTHQIISPQIIRSLGTLAQKFR
jgi:hypothetical protein